MKKGFSTGGRDKKPVLTPFGGLLGGNGGKLRIFHYFWGKKRSFPQLDGGKSGKMLTKTA